MTNKPEDPLKKTEMVNFLTIAGYDYLIRDHLERILNIYKKHVLKHTGGVLLLALLLFVVTSAGLYLLVAGIRKSINEEDPFFHYLYSIAVLVLAIALYIYIAYSDFLSSISNIEDVTFQFTALWFFSSLIAVIFLIRNALSKRALIVPGVVAGISFSMFFMILTLYISMILF